MHFMVDSLIEINYKIAGSNNFTLRKVNVKPYGCDKNYMDKDLVENKLYQLRRITPVKFYSVLLNKIHPLYDGNRRTCKILFVNYDKIIKLIDGKNAKN